MQRALPVAVKFLHKGNKELSRNMASYLSLAAIEHASLLTPHVQPIMDSIISGDLFIDKVYQLFMLIFLLQEIIRCVEFLHKFMKYHQNHFKDMRWLWFPFCHIVIIKKNLRYYICFR